MKITQPLEGIPIWTFSGLDIPSFPESIVSNRAGYADDVLELQDVKYEKRQIVDVESNSENKKYLQDVLNEIEKAIDNIKAQDLCDKTKKILLDDWYGTEWKFSAKNMHYEVIIDLQDYYMGWHLDNRKNKSNIICNLEDNNSSTEFLILDAPNPKNVDTFIPSKIRWKAPTEKGTGYFWFNHHTLWHQIEIKEKNRKIIKLSNMPCV